MRVLTPAEMRQTDRTAIEDYGFPGLILMEKAAMALRDNRAAGFVVDPFGSCLSFDRAMMEHLAVRKQDRH